MKVPLSTDSCTNPPLNGLYGFNLPKLYICSKFLSNEIDTCENSAPVYAFTILESTVPLYVKII